jgi:ankyrin repeat protein
MLAAKANQVETMKVLIAAGADPKLKAQDGSSLLMAAVGSGHIEAVKLAYEYDQDVKFTTDTGTTLMHAAVTGTTQNSTQDEIVKVVQFLADKGAPLDEKNAQGRTPISIANVLPIDKAVDLLTKLIEKSGAKPKISPKR